MPERVLDTNLDFAPIGNGRIACLIDRKARMNWLCFPKFDANPIFSNLLSGEEEKGFCDITVPRCAKRETRYLRNTCILETLITDEAENVVRIIDFIPRFRRFERIFHPPQVFRRIEPVSGVPRIRIKVRPTFGYGKPAEQISTGSSHIRYAGGSETFRLTTDAPLSYITQESEFTLLQPLTLIFSPDEPIEAGVEQISREFLDRTHQYWLEWVRSLGIPLEWQPDVIRAAITLKLCSFDETGGIVAALTTSIPEAPGSERNWDYRYCWPRDAYFVIKALNNLGATQTMEAYLGYIANIATGEAKFLKPVYGLIYDQSLCETIASDLKGFRGIGPVRVGNQAAEQMQHDTYGSIILGASQMFIDQRLPHMGGKVLFHGLEILGEQALKYFTVPDAGLWEFRGRVRVHTYSATMCWVACDRLAKIAILLGLDDRAEYWQAHSTKLRELILHRGWNEKRRAFVAAFDHEDLDASCLLLPEVGLISADDPRYVSTVEVIGRELSQNGFMLRYTAPDDFGSPEVAFLACQFWYIDALGRIGRTKEARSLFNDLLKHRNSFGIFSEDIHPETKQLWGNIPQTYSMAGIINSAMGLSRPWPAAWSSS
jgi:GH15 family glucan-1,4-alpha-glucosidase